MANSIYLSPTDHQLQSAYAMLKSYAVDCPDDFVKILALLHTSDTRWPPRLTAQVLGIYNAQDHTTHPTADNIINRIVEIFTDKNTILPNDHIGANEELMQAILTAFNVIKEGDVPDIEMGRIEVFYMVHNVERYPAFIEMSDDQLRTRWDETSDTSTLSAIEIEECARGNRLIQDVDVIMTDLYCLDELVILFDTMTLENA